MTICLFFKATKCSCFGGKSRIVQSMVEVHCSQKVENHCSKPISLSTGGNSSSLNYDSQCLWSWSDWCRELSQQPTVTVLESTQVSTFPMMRLWKFSIFFFFKLTLDLSTSCDCSEILTCQLNWLLLCLSMHRWILFLESAHLPCPCLLPRILFITLPPRTRGTHAASDTWPVTRLLLITWQEGHFPVIRSTWENHKRLCLNYWYRWLLKSTIHQKETCYITKEWCYGHNVTALLDWAYCILLVWWLDEISLIACTSWQSQPGQLGVVWAPEATPWAGSIEVSGKSSRHIRTQH